MKNTDVKAESTVQPETAPRSHHNNEAKEHEAEYKSGFR